MISYVHEVEDSVVYRQWYEDERSSIPDYDGSIVDDRSKILAIKLHRSIIVDSLPMDIKWYLVTFYSGYMDEFRFLKCNPWSTLTGNSYRLGEAYRNIYRDPVDFMDKNVAEAVSKIRGIEGNDSALRGFRPILVASSDVNTEEDCIIIEGCHRAVALYSSTSAGDMDAGLRFAFLGVSEGINKNDFAFHPEYKGYNK
ncbi:MAG: hypothetical protein KGH98_02875 [Candidatus Micrarchaeota archaeon]|nr:hypothetical protein [Candidatus Micrarchaeota archaeon]